MISKMKINVANREGIVNDSLLRSLIGDDDEAISRIYLAFLESGQSIFEEISLALEEPNWTPMLDATHKLKSSALSVGATGVYESAISIELLIQSDRPREEITIAVNFLNEQFTLVGNVIRG